MNRKLREYLEDWECKKYPNGVLLLNTKLNSLAMYYRYYDGAILKGRKLKTGKLGFGKKDSGRISKGYLRIALPSSYTNVYNHIIAAKAIGLLDDVTQSSDFQINHKNFDKLDNRPENIELCTRMDNIYHSNLKRICKKFGVWKDDIVIDAKTAVKFITDAGKNNLKVLEQYNDYCKLYTNKN